MKFQALTARGGDRHAPANTLGIRRVAFGVDDINVLIAGLQARGAELVGGVGQLQEQALGSATSADRRGSSSCLRSVAEGSDRPPPRRQRHWSSRLPIPLREASRERRLASQWCCRARRSAARSSDSPQRRSGERCRWSRSAFARRRTLDAAVRDRSYRSNASGNAGRDWGIVTFHRIDSSRWYGTRYTSHHSCRCGRAASAGLARAWVAHGTAGIVGNGPSMAFVLIVIIAGPLVGLAWMWKNAVAGADYRRNDGGVAGIRPGQPLHHRESRSRRLYVAAHARTVFEATAVMLVLSEAAGAVLGFSYGGPGEPSLRTFRRACLFGRASRHGVSFCRCFEKAIRLTDMGAIEADEFERQRSHLFALAYRMLGRARRRPKTSCRTRGCARPQRRRSMSDRRGRI